MTHDREASTGRLLQLVAPYMGLYLWTGIATKYFLDRRSDFPAMRGMEFLAASNWGGVPFALGLVLVLRWWRHLASEASVTVCGVRLPRAAMWIIPSGICTGIIIPTTTIMYTLPISIMVSMLIMRGSVIMIGRIVDEVLIRKGIMHKIVYWQENVAFVFAMGAVVHVLYGSSLDDFAFFASTLATVNIILYVGAYTGRLFIMNWFKHAGYKPDNRGFFAYEQFFAAATVMLGSLLVFGAVRSGLLTHEYATDYVRGFTAPSWSVVFIGGLPFGALAVFSVLLFMFKGRTGTFATLVNRIGSLIAGTFATLVFHLWYGGKPVKSDDWISLGILLVAIFFLGWAERRRQAESKFA